MYIDQMKSSRQCETRAPKKSLPTTQSCRLLVTYTRRRRPTESPKTPESLIPQSPTCFYTPPLVLGTLIMIHVRSMASLMQPRSRGRHKITLPGRAWLSARQRNKKQLTDPYL